MLAASPSGFAAGSQISVPDFALFYVVDSLTRRMLEVASGPDALELLLGDKPAVAQAKQGWVLALISRATESPTYGMSTDPIGRAKER
ncbi:MAG: hypothetical protein ACJ0Q1_05465 [Luminiphilus sp.]